MKILITMGPTQEPIDSVRFITNASSGKMGLALVEEARKRDHNITVVSGLVNIETPDGIKIIRVRTAEEMINSTLQELKRGYDLLISAAAIADYSPREFRQGKMNSSKGEILLRLKPTPKLTKVVRENLPDLFIVAFKAEFNLHKNELLERAKAKLKKENLNLIIANDTGRNRFGSDKTEVWVLDGRGVKHIPLADKSTIAGGILDAIEKAIPSSQ